VRGADFGSHIVDCTYGYQSGNGDMVHERSTLYHSRLSML
jgi:hypothetical protein